MWYYSSSSFAQDFVLFSCGSSFSLFWKTNKPFINICGSFHLITLSLSLSLSVFKNPKPKSPSLSLWLKRELGIGNWGMELEVRLVGGIENCFVSLPLSLVQTLDSSSAHLLTLELRSRTGHRWFVAWSGATSTSSSSAIEVLLIFSHNN